MPLSPLRLLTKIAQAMVVRPMTPPTLMLMPPVIMTMVRAQEMMMRAALSLSRSKNICGFRKPPPMKRTAARYMAAKIPILMNISIWVSVRGSLVRSAAPFFFSNTQFTPSVCALFVRSFFQRAVSPLLITGEPATTMRMMTMAL